jgi:hypothetical protein
MKNSIRIFSLSAFAWAFFTIIGFTAIVLVSPRRGFDVYDLQGGMRALTELPVLVIGGQIIFAWAGVALVIMVLALNELIHNESISFTSKVASAFGLIAGALFLLLGLVGGFSSFELLYLQSTRSAAYIRDAFLPLAIITNRTHIAAIAVLGIWLVLVSWVGLQNRNLPPSVSYLGIGAGCIALLGFVLPGGGFGLLSSLLSALWAILAGFRSLQNINATGIPDFVPKENH